MRKSQNQTSDDSYHNADEYLNFTIETGPQYLLLSILAHIFLRSYYFILGGEKTKIKNNLLLTNKDELRIGLRCILSFNLWLILCNAIKFLKEKIQFYVRKASKNKQFG